MSTKARSNAEELERVIPLAKEALRRATEQATQGPPEMRTGRYRPETGGEPEGGARS